ncbi:unnamed protein product [Strongylus vulgaris]|uniref:ShKT domain-containing protein n=1 Tax=Strongylus vulgaris TaxID=40348 RepID=A0A3P7JIN9_STRVU|nr:unnamed protein product [Strongylus vulgaris]
MALKVALQYDETAVMCEDKLPTAECENIFGKTKVAVGKDDDREEKCFKNAAKAEDDQIKKFAAGICPKTCGYCCKTPEYDCPNSPNPRLECSRVTKDMCKEPLWKPILVQDCPKTCGFCLEGE